MKGSQKANLIVFLIIATLAFTLSLTFASITQPTNKQSYKLTPIENDSFEPAYINKVPTIKPKNITNTTNTTNTNTTHNTTKVVEKTNNTNNEDEEE